MEIVGGRRQKWGRKQNSVSDSPIYSACTHYRDFRYSSWCISIAGALLQPNSAIAILMSLAQNFWISAIFPHFQHHTNPQNTYSLILSSQIDPKHRYYRYLNHQYNTHHRIISSNTLKHLTLDSHNTSYEKHQKELQLFIWQVISRPLYLLKLWLFSVYKLT